MRLHRFIGKFNLDKSPITIKDKEVLNQWKNVLRLEAGDQLILSDGEGHEAEAVIRKIDKKEAVLDIGPKSSPQREPSKKAVLYMSLLKKESFELAIEKATEAGISKIVPMVTARTVKFGFNRERLEKIIREACEQSGRTVVPEISDPMKFQEALASVEPKASIIFDISGKELSTSARGGSASGGNFLLSTNFLIGPEGGFSQEEVLLAKERGLSIASLGKLTLRAETAAAIISFLGTR